MALTVTNFLYGWSLLSLRGCRPNFLKSDDAPTEEQDKCFILQQMINETHHKSRKTMVWLLSAL